METKKLVIGLLAHVDAGKTSLTEAMLYQAGQIRSLGRVDHKNCFLDTHSLERERGITIFSKQADFSYKDTSFTILDTPGHTDFSAEMERTLSVLDACILVISAKDGVQAHTRTLWKLLSFYHIPTFLFVNKMDQVEESSFEKTSLVIDTNKKEENLLQSQNEWIQNKKNDLIKQLQKELSSGILLFEGIDESFFESLAMQDETLLNQYLEKGTIQTQQIQEHIKERKIFPTFFGSALHQKGIEELLEGLSTYLLKPSYAKVFSAYVYKISRDEQGNRLTHLRITGGELKVKDFLFHEDALNEKKEEPSKRLADEKTLQEHGEKVNQIRFYHGNKFTTMGQAKAGSLCVVTGPMKTYPGEWLGDSSQRIIKKPMLEPVMSCSVLFPEGVDASACLWKLKAIEEENPELHVVWNEKLQEIKLRIMGEIQTEILAKQFEERYGSKIFFGSESILYKETIQNTVEGIGHFEPLRHYAEVHLRIEPGQRGSGIVLASDLSEDELSKNWQRLILTHLAEKEHVGVMTGSPLTDVKITLIAGQAHKKHTEGGDFRQATYRAIRQGLMQAESVLLEPYYRFSLELPMENLGRAMTDIELFAGTSETPQINENMAFLTGVAPVSTIRGYAKEVTAYTKGRGFLTLTPSGYALCHDSAAAKARIGYDPDRDLSNPSSSVFCSHGASFVVEWQEVAKFAHLEAQKEEQELQAKGIKETPRGADKETFVGTEEVDDILNKAHFANRKAQKDTRYHKQSVPLPIESSTSKKPKPKKDVYLLVDGYNIIFAWEELKSLAASSIDAARDKLLDILCNYQGIVQCKLIAVFDAYRVQGHLAEYYPFHNIHVVFTKEAETADQYIERFTKEKASEYEITVATSDHLEQMIIIGAGSHVLNAKEFQIRVREAEDRLREDYLSQTY